MPTTIVAPELAKTGEQHLVLHGVSWDQYVTISDALPDRPGLRVTYLDGNLTFMTVSRNHDWIAEILGYLVAAVATGCGIRWEPAGCSTYRRKDINVGIEGDKTFYFGPHADLMQGPLNIDLATQPPPDLAIEVEVTHPADDAMIVWGRLGVPEVWRFDAESETVGFWLRGENGTYLRVERSRAFPILTPSDVNGQIRLADELGSGRWFAQLGDWVRAVLVPRMRGGA